MRNLADSEELEYMASGMTPGFVAAPYRFVRGEGAILYGADGSSYIDFCAGTFTNSIGHCHPVAVEFMRERLSELWNIHDYSSPFRFPLLKKLKSLTPEHIDTFQFYTGGSETVEAGIRALRSWLPDSRQTIAGFVGAYHGKTLGSRQIFHWNFPGENTSEVLQLPFPDQFGLTDSERDLMAHEVFAKIEQLLTSRSDVGAIIFEPILGAGGNLHAPHFFWQKFEQLCKRLGILMFADEICVGFGRTGYDFSFQRYGLNPDLIAFAKGLGGGFPTMCLAGRKEIMNAPPFGERGGSSTTFGGNPLSLAAMNITLDIYEQEKLAANALALEPLMRNELERLQGDFRVISDFRVTGLMATLNLKLNEPLLTKTFAMQLHRQCLEHGLKVMTFDHLFRIAPPLNVSSSILLDGFSRMRAAFVATLAEIGNAA